LYHKGNYELRILFESDLLDCVQGVVRIAMPAMPESGVGTLPTPERTTYKIGVGWEVSLIPIRVI
jgi:hypothetical protein